MKRPILLDYEFDKTTRRWAMVAALMPSACGSSTAPGVGGFPQGSGGAMSSDDGSAAGVGGTTSTGGAGSAGAAGTGRDASTATGGTRDAGAIDAANCPAPATGTLVGWAAVPDLGTPIALARAVLEAGEHVLLAGPEAWRFAAEVGIRPAPPGALITDRMRARLPAGRDGRIACTARANAIRGRVPAS